MASPAPLPPLSWPIPGIHLWLQGGQPGQSPRASRAPEMRGISGVLPPPFPCHILKARGMRGWQPGLGGGKGQALCWVAPGQPGHLGTSYRLRVTLSVCAMVSHAGGGIHHRADPFTLFQGQRCAHCCIMGGHGRGLAGLGNLDSWETKSDRMERGGAREAPPTLVSSVREDSSWGWMND